ncbi:MAG TPA: chemotaxis protein CheA [Cyanobacteria bacterium UBA11149]|nr:chemotaxis protein CheA [Cyanobacteria bacterium UBA11367]HBE57330.1 chemotaxis protein CheA [Cyanobacteria bacterium UBA11366]HBK64435.1 chemotaxis protein CheA [Cyanobacteria bacterium UBA11166]HBR72325.1 chemotaxis protein CheA [Cyanobacteria bacterium UBA11159]HBS70419.1 chemotaxis protein CheA [Cyanobacteria bacterium UBA11153]HBW89363.1 chemotaxis protein CheA [Cyanobacteria bacterium UBA11149]HCA97651.1 chemotaxis protein CheA [Cyanobacteria bacterium UBA9226]
MEIDEDLKEFLIEGYEYLNRMEGDLVALEQDCADSEVINRIYRSLHTIKGNSGFLGLEKLQLVTHGGENLLSHLRDNPIVPAQDTIGTESFTSHVTTALLQVVDAVREHFQSLEATGLESDTDCTSLMLQLSQLVEREWEVRKEREENPQSLVSSDSSVLLREENVDFNPPISTLFKEDNLDISQPSSPPAPQLPLSTISLATNSAIINPQAAEIENTDSDANQFKVTDTSIRVDVNLLDKLMNLVGELVLCRNQIIEFANTQEEDNQRDNGFKSASGRLNLITSELQEGVMKTRMQPIRTIWSKFPRVVRDIAVTLGKQVRLEMEGEDTELDKTLIEAIANPLTHLIRNCLDHGLETPEVRTALGKSPVGRLSVRAYHESGQVNIEISDDGAGIDPDKVKEKALQRGIITPERFAQLRDREALNLIFLPSFSTAEKITSISGRGVGMDVVRANLEKINGTIDVQSKIGQGTTFKLRIPLTLAIIPTLIITTGGDRYAIPQVNLLELVRLEGKQAKPGIELFHNTPVYRLRGQLLPLVYLNHELQIANSDVGIANREEENNQESTTEDDILNIVVVQASDKPFGLVVDTINDTQEIVVKPLGKQLKSINCFAGATIMGDGKVALILDVQGLAQKTQLISEADDKKLVSERNQNQESPKNTEQILLLQGPDSRRMGIPLSNVSRLEEISPTLLERLGKGYAIQYRQQIMPLINLSTVFGSNGYSHNLLNTSFSSKTDNTDDKLPIVVVSVDGEKQIGLIVEQVLDIVEQAIDIKGKANQPGILYNAVIQGQVTEILNVETVIGNH